VLIIEAAQEDEGFVTVSVSDTGPGLAPEVANRLFQPFTTTKERGMGVGLSICQSIVEAHGGKIWSEANLPQGVTFRFRLPVIATTNAA
jgi:two-component system sensor kinase FixL